MTTYKFRIRFHLAHKGLITGDDESVEFKLPNGHSALLKPVDSKEINEATMLVVLSGGYKTEQEAFEYGTRVKDSLLCYGVKFRVGIDIGNDKATFHFFNNFKEKYFQEQGIKLIDDVHGISVYSEEFPTSAAYSSPVFLLNAKPVIYFVKEIGDFVEQDLIITDQLKLAMELMTSSCFDSSPRSRFITLILALESILEPESRPIEVQSLVNELISCTKKSTIQDLEKESILGSLNWLRKDSISRSLRKMAIKYLPNRDYSGLSSEKFIKLCYEARSNLVHTGKVDEAKINIGTLAANLEMLLKDLIAEIVGTSFDTNV